MVAVLRRVPWPLGTRSPMLEDVSFPAYVVDPADPRAPAQALWEALPAAERARIVAELPSELPRAYPPEGDPHRVPTERARDALGGFFSRLRRKIYLSSDLPVYYPAEPMFAPDLIAVLDVEDHLREKWVVSAEGRGLDLALEVYVSGERKKDLERNVERFARLGIPEYFIFEPRKGSLRGYRLKESGGSYEPVVPQGGRWSSEVLGLDLVVSGALLRFYHGTAPLLEAPELIEDLERRVGATQAREEALAEELEREKQRAEAQQERAERLARRLRELGHDPGEL